jgi:signal transduction histidine kinase/ligand-binding sensor domain-containing protein
LLFAGAFNQRSLLTKLKKLIPFILLLFSASYLCAQPYYFKHYQVENGLSNNTVYCSVQDSKGFMWFGTKDGLNRFDGYSFKTYRNNPDEDNSIGNDFIHVLHVDKNETLWIGTSKGLYTYNPVSDNFKLVNGTGNMSIHDVESDLNNNLWIVSASHLFKFDKKHKSITPLKEKFASNSVYCRQNGSIWISTLSGTIENYDPVTAAFHSHSILNKKNGGNATWISCIEETNDNKLLVGTTTQGVKLYDIATEKVTDLITLNNDMTRVFVRDMIKSSKDEFWIGTESGIYVYNHNSGQIVHLHKQYNNNYTLSDNAVYSLSKDREGGIWPGTFFGGINYFSPQSSIFSKYFPLQQPNSISGSDVREITKDKFGNLWIGTEDAGLNKLNLKTGLFTSFIPNGDQNSIAYANVHGLLPDDDKLWISTFEHGLDIMDIKSGRIIKHYSAGKGNALRSNFIFSFCKTRSGKVVMATTNGMYIYNPKTDDFDPVPGLPFVFYNSIMEDSKGNLWAGSYYAGLFRFKLGINDFKNFRNVEGKPTSISNNTVNNVFEDSKKNIWVTTDGGGLCLYNNHNATFTRYMAPEGMPSNFLFKIQEDEDYKLWISSTRGLIRFDPITKKVKTYSKSDGLLTDQFNYNSSFKDTDGRMYFGSVKGLISFMPKELNTRSYSVPVYATGFHLDYDESAQKSGVKLAKSILYTDTINLEYNQSSFSIDFAALSFFSPEMTEYAYKMSGLYKDWEYLKTNRKVYFTKLVPGRYLFEAKAMINGSNTWSNQNLKILFIVQPPFWKSPAAYLVYLCIISAALTFLFRRYHKKLEIKNERRMEFLENEKEKELYHAKIEFFTNVAHDIRTPLTLIKGPMEKLIKQAESNPAMEKNLKIMDRNTNRLFDLTNQLLDFRKTEISGFSLNFVKTNISELIQEISIDFQLSAENKQIKYHIILPDDPFYAYIDIEAFHKIVSNLIDNALKYGKSKVIVKLLPSTQEEQPFYIKILSDGKAIPTELAEKIFEPFFRVKEAEMKLGTGIGLAISRSLAELHKGSLILEQNNNEFNIFTLELPVHQLFEFNLHGKWKKI